MPTYTEICSSPDFETIDERLPSSFQMKDELKKAKYKGKLEKTEDGKFEWNFPLETVDAVCLAIKNKLAEDRIRSRLVWAAACKKNNVQFVRKTDAIYEKVVEDFKILIKA